MAMIAMTTSNSMRVKAARRIMGAPSNRYSQLGITLIRYHADRPTDSFFSTASRQRPETAFAESRDGRFRLEELKELNGRANRRLRTNDCGLVPNWNCRP